MLIQNGLEAWLEDQNGVEIKHEDTSYDEPNDISAIFSVDAAQVRIAGPSTTTVELTRFLESSRWHAPFVGEQVKGQSPVPTGTSFQSTIQKTGTVVG